MKYKLIGYGFISFYLLSVFFTSSSTKIRIYKRQIGDKKLHFLYKKQHKEDRQKVVVCNLPTLTSAPCGKSIFKKNFASHLAEVHSIGENLKLCPGPECEKRFINNSRRRQHESVCISLNSDRSLAASALIAMSKTSLPSA